ncbi:type I polyketide synthase [Herbidospora sp. RD11066]
MTYQPVAVVGLACRLPQAPHPEAFWRLLRDGVDAVTEVPPGRWDDTVPAPRAGAFLDDVAGFDAAFFGISPREAAAMDPQQRLMLELSWEALEDAGLPGTRRTGVFYGAIWDDYATLTRQRDTTLIGRHTLAGTQRSAIANRVSHFLGASGPSLVVDSGQSSSLVAVHMAAESLRRGECALALAGGVNLNLSPDSALACQEFGGLSPDGRVHLFDARANGYARGEGGGVVVLKLLDDAVADGDDVYCVLLGGAVNNGQGAGLTVPSAVAQEELIRLACDRAGVAFSSVQYVELHGTGTPVGDPIEAAALSAARAPGSPPLVVGSAKTNVGHLEGGAGITGLIKTVLAIHHRELPATLNHSVRHPAIPAGIVVQTSTGSWPFPEERLVAGVSSFGMGGTNCHVVVAEPPVASDEFMRSEGPTAWVLSGHTPAALRDQAGRLLASVDGYDERDVAYSLVTSRVALEYRAAVVGEGDELREGLRALAGGVPAPNVVQGVAGSASGVVMVFPGQGSQWAGMTAELLDASPVFAARMGACAEALRPHVGWDLIEVLRSGRELDDDEIVQPVLWAVMVSLAELWRSHGVEPAAVVGHSQGEVAAAVVAGAISLADAARLVVARLRALRAVLGRGAMLALGMSAEEAGPYLSERVGLAVDNGPGSVVLSGDLEPLAEIEAEAVALGVRARLLPIGYASHGPQIEQVREALLTELAFIEPVPARVPFFSSVTVGWARTEGLDASYWYANLRGTVRFHDAVTALTEAGYGPFIEVSPHPILSQQLSTLRRGEGARRFLTSLAEARVAGVPVDFGFAGRRVKLPTYAFQRTDHWLEGAARERTAVEPAEAPVAPVSATSYDDVLALVKGHAAAVQGYGTASEIDGAHTFKKLGFDSLGAVELRNRLAAATGLAVDGGMIFDFPTPVALARHLYERLTPTGSSTDALGVLGELDRLKAVLGRLDAGGPDRDRITARLADLLAEWQGPGADLGSFSDDELFDVIDNELGIA